MKTFLAFLKTHAVAFGAKTFSGKALAISVAVAFVAGAILF